MISVVLNPSLTARTSQSQKSARVKEAQKNSVLAWAVSYTQSRYITWARAARAPGNAGYSAFQHKKRRTKSRRACAEAAPRAVATTLRLVRPGEATVILAYHSDRLSIARDRFEVLGVRGDINKSTFGTEDKCNPLEAIIGAALRLRYQTLRSLTATEIGAAPRRRHVTQGGGGRCE